jgi:hypothetical protein
MEFITIIFLLMTLFPSIGWSNQQILVQGPQYVQTQTIPNACLVSDDPRFPQSYIDRNGPCVKTADKNPQVFYAQPAPTPFVSNYDFGESNRKETKDYSVE